MTRKPIIYLSIAALLACSGCATTKGVESDVKAGAAAVQNAAAGAAGKVKAWWTKDEQEKGQQDAKAADPVADPKSALVEPVSDPQPAAPAQVAKPEPKTTPKPALVKQTKAPAPAQKPVEKRTENEEPQAEEFVLPAFGSMK